MQEKSHMKQNRRVEQWEGMLREPAEAQELEEEREQKAGEGEEAGG